MAGRPKQKQKAKPRASAKPAKARKPTRKPAAKSASKRGRPSTGGPAVHAQNMATQSRKKSAGVRDIGPIPAISDKNWNRRLACLADPELFLRTYYGFHPFFPLPFSESHGRVITKGEDAIQSGGNFVYACWRGFGKTTIVRGMLIRAVLSGLRRFGLFVGAAAPHAQSSLRTIKAMLERSPLLLEDFPEIIYPIAKLEGQSKRQIGQACLGVPTNIHWGSDFVQLPTCPEQPSIRPEQGAGYGAMVSAAGILSSGITGLNMFGVRPDLLCLDDPQTRQSAKSVMQCALREEIVGAMITGLAAPGTRLGVFIPCTVMRQGDLADRLLDHAKHPEFAIERCKLMPSMPKRMDLWDKYRNIRNDFDPYSGPEDKSRASRKATEFYGEHRADMDSGAEAAWPEKFNDDEISAIQNAMNSFLDNKFSFMAEMQSEPMPVDLGNVEELPRSEIEKRLNGEDRGRVPHGATKLTAFLDVQGIGVLFYTVIAWKDDFTGWLIDYGTFPDQGRHYFTKATLSQTFEQGDQALHSAIKNAATTLLGKHYTNAGGVPMMLDLLLIDSGHQAEIVYQVCRQLKLAGYGNRILPSKGEGNTASDKYGFCEGGRATGEEMGFEWRLPMPKETRGIKLLRYNTNGWKSFVMDRIGVKDGGPSSLTFYGSPPASGERHPHGLLIDHIMAEFRDRKTSERTGRTVDEWGARTGQDNDFWDCLVGASVAASVCRVRLEGIQQPAKQPRGERRSWAQSKADAEAKR